MSNLCFPKKVLDQHAAVLGKTGAGKSSAMRHVVEYLLDHSKRVCVVDPKGDWWGLKAGGDGKSAGYPVITFGNFKGGYEADVPINEQSGKHVAELITSGNRPCVIGFRGWFTAHMTQFWIDFAKTLFHTNEGELYLIIDEAQNFAPKGRLADIEGRAGTGLHWTNRLLAEGRGLGINIWVGSQRPQKVHNDTLDGCETLVAMRTVHPAARGAIKDWIDGAEDKEKGKEVLASIGGMKRGEAIIWSPEIEFGPERVTFPMFSTFDSFAPPQLQKKVTQRTWADVDLDEVKNKLAKVIEDAKANDPKELQKQVAQLKAELAKRDREKPAAPAPVQKTREVQVLKDPQISRLEKFSNGFSVVLSGERAKIEKLFEKFEAAAAPIKDGIAKVNFANTEPRSASPSPAVAKRIGAAEGPARDGHKPLMRNRQPAMASPTGITAGDTTLPPRRQRILNALAFFESLGQHDAARSHVAFFCATSSNSSTFEKDLSAMRTAALVHYPSDGRVQLTDDGRAKSATPDPLTLGEYHQNVYRLLPPRRGRIARAVIAIYPEALTREQLASECETSPDSSTFEKDLSAMRTAGLVEYPMQGTVAATETLFPPLPQ